MAVQQTTIHINAYPIKPETRGLVIGRLRKYHEGLRGSLYELEKGNRVDEFDCPQVELNRAGILVVPIKYRFTEPTTAHQRLESVKNATKEIEKLIKVASKFFDASEYERIGATAYIKAFVSAVVALVAAMDYIFLDRPLAAIVGLGFAILGKRELNKGKEAIGQIAKIFAEID